MSTVLKRITNEAKRIRKRHPSMMWKTAVKEASKKIKKGGSKKKSRKKQTRRKKKVSGDLYIKHEGVGAIGNIQKTKSTLRKQLNHKLKNLLFQKDTATKKTVKKKKAKIIRLVKRELAYLK